MATIKSFTDISQSKKLAEILPLESADMYYREWKRMTKDIRIAHVGSAGEKDLPCWSLAALLGVLPEGWSSVLTKSFNGEDYYCKLDGEPIETMADNPVDACYEMIIRLNELKML